MSPLGVNKLQWPRLVGLSLHSQSHFLCVNNVTKFSAHTQTHSVFHMCTQTRTDTKISTSFFSTNDGVSCKCMHTHAHKQRQDAHTVVSCSHRENTIQSSAFNSTTEALRHPFQQSAKALFLCLLS